MGKLYAYAEDDTLEEGTTVMWKWAVSNVAARPAPDTDVVFVNEKDGRTVSLRVESVSCGGDPSRGRRASGCMQTVVLGAPTAAGAGKAVRRARKVEARTVDGNVFFEMADEDV